MNKVTDIFNDKIDRATLMNKLKAQVEERYIRLTKAALSA